MRICILTPRFPFPEKGGDVLRINNIARYLKSQNHQLILLSFVESDPALKQAYELYDTIYTVRHNRFFSTITAGIYLLCGKPLQCGYYHSIQFSHRLQQIIKSEHPQLFIAHLLRMTPYLENASTLPHTIVEMTDALSKTYYLSQQSSRISLKRFIYSLEYRLIRNYEQHVIHKYPKVVVVSDADVQYLSQSGTKVPSLHCYPNGVYPAPKPPTVYNPNKICFVGNMRTLQNQDAAIYFAEEILPIIVKANPQTIFYIVGAEPSYRIKQLAYKKHIVITDYVNNVENVISDACLTVAPIRIAAGIQNKVLIAMGQHVPVIMSSLIANAITNVKDGENCLIRDNIQDFAQACLQLMSDQKLRNSIADAGYQMVKNSYVWNEKLHGYEHIDI